MNTEAPIIAAGPERAWEVGCHLSALAGYLIAFGGILGPLIVWLLKRGEYPSVNEHGREALNFQITWLIYYVICVPLVFFFVGIPLMGVLWVASLILTIIAGVKASRGELFRYPLTIRFI